MPSGNDGLLRRVSDTTGAESESSNAAAAAPRRKPKRKLKEVLRDFEDGLAIAPTNYTARDAVNDWLQYGLAGNDPGTVDNYKSLCEHHVLSELGETKLRDLGAEDVDKWLAAKAEVLSTRPPRLIRSCLNRSVKRAMARDKRSATS